nr:hypothetical protein [Tanacetum cinerariifolium]
MEPFRSVEEELNYVTEEEDIQDEKEEEKDEDEDEDAYKDLHLH